LEKWADRKNSRPLLIRGARRVGKTYALKKLGEEKFRTDGIAYCDFQTNLEQLNYIFSGTTEVDRIVSDLALFLRQDVIEGKTLIALDEIQLCEKALNSLRFFAQSNYRVIATGSQLGIALRDRTLPFPSDVDQVVLRPMDFEEFLWACNEKRMADAIREAFTENKAFLLHEEALALYHKYIVVGGMPLVASEFTKNNDYDQVRTLQAEIDRTYAADIALYAPKESAVHAQAVWESIPMQLARETTRKFKYTDVAKGGRERKYRAPLAWLEAAELVLLNYQTNETQAPLIARGDGAFFKVYLADTGIMFYRLNISPDMYLDKTKRQALSARFRGALAENYVMQTLVANDLNTFYWVPGTTSQSEVEFILQNRHGVLIPVEVKSGDNVNSASLNMYIKKSKCPFAIRISAKNYGFENGILSVPLYAAFCIDEQSMLKVQNPLNL